MRYKTNLGLSELQTPHDLPRLMRRWRQRSLESAVLALARVPWRGAERIKVLRAVKRCEASTDD
jgi:hypothetical protein